MISGLYIADTQGEILIERTYITPPPRETVKKLILTQLNLGEGEKARPIENEIVWEMDQHYIYAIRRDQIILLALTEGDVLTTFILRYRPLSQRCTKSCTSWNPC